MVWEIANGTCATEDQMLINYYQDPLAANAGLDQTAVCADQVTMAADPPIAGVGVWTQVGATPSVANIASTVSPATVISDLVAGVYTFDWTVTNGTCPTYTDQVTVTVEETPETAVAGPDQKFCSLVTSATLAATPVSSPTTGAWSIVSKPSGAPDPTFSPSSSDPAATANGLQEGIYVFEWTTSYFNSGSGITCESTDQVTITNVPVVADAITGTDDELCYGEAMLLVGNTPTVGTGKWTQTAGSPVFILNSTNPTTQVLGYTAGTYTFRWEITYDPDDDPPCTDFDDVTITVHPLPTQALAGADQNVCAAPSTSTSTVLAGNTPAGGETGTWSWISGPNVVTFSSVNANTPGATANGLFPGPGAAPLGSPNIYELQWTIANATNTCFSSDNMLVDVWEEPTTAAAGTDQEWCNVTGFTLTAGTVTVGQGVWTKVSGPAGVITSPTSATTTVTGTVPGTYVFRWTTTHGTTLTGPACTSIDEVTIYNYADLAAGGPVGATVCDGGTATLSALATGGSGAYTYVWEMSTGDCTSPSFSPIVPAATGPTYTTPALAATTSYRVIISDANGICTPPLTSNCATVTVVPDPIITAQPAASTICSGGTQTLTAVGWVDPPFSVTYQWQKSTTGCAGTFTNISGATSSTYITPGLTTTTYYRVIVAATGSGCFTGPSACATVTVNPKPIINTQPQNATRCVDDAVSFTSTASPGAGGTLSYQWEVSTNGGTTWSTSILNVVGTTTTTTLTINPVTLAMNNYRYRMVVTETGTATCTTNSSAAILTARNCYSLGNQIWADANGNGLLDGGESGIDGVTVRLLNPDGTPADNPNIPGIQPYVVTTSGGGYYRFDNILAGNYIVEVVGGTGTPLDGYFSSTINAGDPDLDVDDNDDNGTVIVGTNVRSQPVTLGPGNSEPTGETNLGPGDPGQPDARSNLTVDFGFIQPMNVGDYVWYDTNNDGTQDGGEPPVVGATMTIYNANGTPVTVGANGLPYTNTTLTNSSGNYSFTNLPPGEYYVVMTPPVPGYEATLGGTDDPDTDPSNTDNNGSLIGGVIRTQNFFLVNGTEPAGDGDGTNGNLTIDFGLAVYSLGNQVWNDPNNNGIIDGGESGISGVPVRLYAFDGVTEIPVGPDGILGTADDAPGGVLTDANGNYRFDNLPAGTFVVEVDTPTGLRSSTVNGGDPDTNPTDGDDNGVIVTGTTVQSNPVTLGPNGSEPTGETGAPGTTDDHSNLTVDFGFYEPLSVGSYVWYDTNADGQQGLPADEPPMIGVTVKLFTAAGVEVPVGPDGILGTADDGPGGMLTDANGEYLFDGLGAGDYYVVIENSPVGLDLTTSGGDVDANISDTDSNGELILGEIRSQVFTLLQGTETETPDNGDNNYQAGVDFGFVGYSLGNRIWEDRNDNGVIDVGEPGIPNVTVRLLDALGNPVPDPANPSIDYVVTTDANGYYRFDNLPAGDYIVEVVTPVAYQSSTMNAGDPESDPDDSDDNGTVIGAGTVRSDVVTLGGLAEPTGESDLGPGDTGATAAPDNRSNLTVDFGFFEPLSVGNYVWYDANANGIQDPGETPVDGATVQLYDEFGNEILVGPDGILGTSDDAPGGVITGGDGLYEFSNLNPGNYYIVLTPPVSTYEVSPINGGDPDGNASNTDNNAQLISGVIRTDVFTLSTGGEPPFGVDGDGDNGNQTIDLALVGYSLGNQVWFDKNNDGLYQPNGVDAIGGNADDEPGIDGVTVHLYASDGVTPIDDPNQPGYQPYVVTTAGGGFYRFDNLAPGDYVVSIDLPGGYAASSTVDAGDPETDVDDNDDNGTTPNNYSSTVSSGVVTLGPGGSEPTTGDSELGPGDTNPADAYANLTVDFGLIQPVNLGNRVWLDVNGDGIQDVGEPGLDGAVLKLLVNDGTGNYVPAIDINGNPVLNQTTAGGGLYNFTNLPPGEYIVQVVSGPPGYDVLSPGGADPDADPSNTDSNAYDNAGTIETLPITLISTTEPNTGADGDGTDGNFTVDLGYVGYNLGNLVWFDSNNNGLKDPGESSVGAGFSWNCWMPLVLR
ncbi:MAG: hypothetical protein IPL49_17150 [Saprospirales bacterium]|nr:hypothetical protein [Saprospirales bacterium]